MIANENIIQSFKQKANWFIVIGIILIVLGCLALGYQFIATVFSVYFIGSLIFIAGIIQVHSTTGGIRFYFRYCDNDCHHANKRFLWLNVRTYARKLYQ